MITAAQLCTPAPEPATLDRPLQHLLACHRRIEQRLETLLRAASAIESDPEEARRAIANVLRFLTTNGVWHTEDEELSLFPRLRAHGLATEDDGFLRELEAQHERVESVVERLREATPAELAARAQDAVRSYREHIAFEESRLLEVAHALSEADLAAISAEMKARRGLA